MPFSLLMYTMQLEIMLEWFQLWLEKRGFIFVF